MGAAKKQVMDVSKPGKAAATATTRPLIVGHGSMVQDPMVRRANGQAAQDAEDAGTQPTRGKIVLKPLSESSAADDDVKSRFAGVTATKANITAGQDAEATVDPLMSEANSSEEADAEQANANATAGLPGMPLPDLVDDGAKPQEPTTDAEEPGQDADDDNEQTADDSSATSSAKHRSTDKPIQADKPAASDKQDADDDNAPLGDDAASVDAVVSQASLKKANQDEENKRKEQEAAYQKLIDDKTYFVRTGQPKSSKVSRYIMGSIMLVLLLGAVYTAADAGAFGSSVKVPYHVFPQSTGTGDAPTNTPTTPAQGTPTPTPTTPAAPSLAANLSQFTDAVLGLNFSYPTTWGTPAVESGKLNDTGTESVKTYRITFKDLTSAEVRITQNNWVSSQKAPVLMPLGSDVFASMSADALAAPYLSISTTGDSYVLLAYASSDKTVQLQAAKKLTLRLIDAQYIEFYGAPVTGDKAQTCTTAAKTSTGAATRLPSKECAIGSDIKDVQNLIASMKAT